MDEISRSTEVSAPAPVVYELISDLPRMGEWSPECRRCDWLGGATGPAIGARFRGRNRRGVYRWSTTGEVVALEPDREIAFDISFRGMPVARWRYSIDSLGGGRCRVTESWTDRRGGVMRAIGVVGTGVRDRATHNAAGMDATLQRLKEAAEAG